MVSSSHNTQPFDDGSPNTTMPPSDPSDLPDSTVDNQSQDTLTCGESVSHAQAQDYLNPDKSSDHVQPLGSLNGETTSQIEPLEKQEEENTSSVASEDSGKGVHNPDSPESLLPKDFALQSKPKTNRKPPKLVTPPPAKELIYVPSAEWDPANHELMHRLEENLASSAEQTVKATSSKETTEEEPNKARENDNPHVEHFHPPPVIEETGNDPLINNTTLVFIHLAGIIANLLSLLIIRIPLPILGPGLVYLLLKSKKHYRQDVATTFNCAVLMTVINVVCRYTYVLVLPLIAFFLFNIGYIIASIWGARVRVQGKPFKCPIGITVLEVED